MLPDTSCLLNPTKLFFIFLFSIIFPQFALSDSGNAEANSKQEFWPGVKFDPSIPKLSDVLGHEPGEKITPPDELVRYLEALSLAAPERTKLVTYATSWQGRPLVYIVISSKENIQRLAKIQSNMQKLASPAGITAAQQAAIIETTPPVSWLSYGVHGDEISSSDAALLTAYHLLAASDSADVDKILNDSVVVIDPSQNPDGRSRFVEHYRQIYGLVPSVHQLSAEHLQAWPGGRTNHYLFDMNRDWFAQTQPEVQGRIKHYLLYQPVVHADIHEMGADSSYYFPPPAEPLNPQITDSQKDNLQLYGMGNAKAFDQFNFDYFTREIFDAYYPGYGDTWPTFQGATGMTFEMASARGLATLRLDGRVLTYRDGVHRHFVSSLATLKTTAVNRDRLLEDFVQYRRSAMNSKKHYLLAGGDISLQKKMAGLLSKQGIKVQQTAENTKICGHEYPKGSIVIAAGQPAGRLAQTLLDSENPIATKFWQEQLRRRELGLEVELYDILAWSVPALFNLDVNTCSKKMPELIAYDEMGAIQYREFAKASLAYLVPWGTQAAVKFLSHALRSQLIVNSADKSFTINNRRFEKGALIIKVKENNDDVYEKLMEISTLHDVEVVSSDASWVSDGINFGSSYVKRLYPPKIAIAWDSPTISYAAGNTRFVIERQMDYPTTPIRTKHLNKPELEDFNVLILPDSYGYQSVLGESGQENISDWVKNGGTLITLGRASRLLLANGLDLLSSGLESRNEELLDDDSDSDSDDDSLKAASFIETEEDYNIIVHEREAKPDYLPGVLLKGLLYQDHWMSGGVESSLNFMVTGSDVYTPLVIGEGTNLVKYAGEEAIVVSGEVWPENKLQLAHKPAIMINEVGRGQVIAFTTDPAFRAYLDGLNVILANAILKGPSHTLGR